MADGIHHGIQPGGNEIQIQTSRRQKKTHKEVNGDQDDFERKEGETHDGMTLVLFIRARRWRGVAGNPEAIAEATAMILILNIDMKMRSKCNETMNPRNNPETFCGGQKHLRRVELII